MVVSDIEMSEMDGYAFTRTLRETPGLPAPLRAAAHLAGQCDEQRERRAWRRANAVLTKFSSPELTDCLIDAAKAVARQGH